MVWLPNQQIAIALDENKVISGQEEPATPLIENPLVKSIIEIIEKYS